MKCDREGYPIFECHKDGWLMRDRDNKKEKAETSEQLVCDNCGCPKPKKTYDSKLKTMDVITSHDYPAIPTRNYDWSAVRQSYDEGDIIGHGKTKQDAINDLVRQENER